MTVSLNCYFVMLEELFILNHEMKEEMLKIEGKRPDNKTYMHKTRLPCMIESEFSIKQTLEEAGTDAYLMTGNLHNSDIYYVTHFLASDDFTYLQTGAGEEVLFISEMEKGRAKIESRISTIKTTQDLGYREKMKEKKRSFYRLCSLPV